MSTSDLLKFSGFIDRNMSTSDLFKFSSFTDRAQEMMAEQIPTQLIHICTAFVIEHFTTNHDSKVSQIISMLIIYACSFYKPMFWILVAITIAIVIGKSISSTKNIPQKIKPVSMVLYSEGILDVMSKPYPKIAAILKDDNYRRAMIQALRIQQCLTVFNGSTRMKAYNDGINNLITWYIQKTRDSNHVVFVYSSCCVMCSQRYK